MSRYAVFVLTAGDPAKVIPWLQGYGFLTDTDNGSDTWQLQNILLVTNRKLPAVIYIDNRALRFWSWNQAMSDIELLAPTFNQR